MTIKRRRDSGFTLIEMLVVVLIIGILAAIAIPSYLKSVETTKADDAVAMLNMIGTTNKMYALDHANAYIQGSFPSAPTTMGDLSCGPGTCGATANGCELVWCKYLADQNWGMKPYAFYACDPIVACPTVGGTGKTSHADRKSGTYDAWGYSMNNAGIISPIGGAPAPTY